MARNPESRSTLQKESAVAYVFSSWLNFSTAAGVFRSLERDSFSIKLFRIPKTSSFAMVSSIVSAEGGPGGSRLSFSLPSDIVMDPVRASRARTSRHVSKRRTGLTYLRRRPAKYSAERKPGRKSRYRKVRKILPSTWLNSCRTLCFRKCDKVRECRSMACSPHCEQNGP